MDMDPSGLEEKRTVFLSFLDLLVLDLELLVPDPLVVPSLERRFFLDFFERPSDLFLLEPSVVVQ